MFERMPTGAAPENNVEEDSFTPESLDDDHEQLEADTAAAGLEMLDGSLEVEGRIKKLMEKFGETPGLRTLHKKAGFLRKLSVSALLALTLSTEDASGQEHSADQFQQYAAASAVEHTSPAVDRSDSDEGVVDYEQLLMSEFASGMDHREKQSFTALEQLDMSIQADITAATEKIYPDDDEEGKEKDEGVYVTPKPFAQSVTVGYKSEDGSLHMNVEINRDSPEFNLTYNF